MRCSYRLALLASVLIGAPSVPWAGTELRAGIETRYFPNRSGIQPSGDFQSSGTLWVLQERAATDGGIGWSFELFARKDQQDNQRTHADIRQGLLKVQISDSVQVSAGFGREFWGVTESFHLVNIINQIDAVEDLDAEDLLGQPMLKLQTRWPGVTWALYALPGFRERPMHARGARLSGELALSRQRPGYESGAEDKHIDWASRVMTQIGSIDAGLSYFQGTSREPRPLFEDEREVTPFYDQIRQVSLDAQLTEGRWLLKLEALRRWGHGQAFSAWIAGLEVTSYNILGTGADLGWVVEYLHDQRNPFDAPPTPFDDDLFLGLRWQANDVSDSSLLVGLFHDQSNGERFLRLEGQRRMADRFTVALEASLPLETQENTPFHSIRNDGFVSLTATLNLGWHR